MAFRSSVLSLATAWLIIVAVKAFDMDEPDWGFQAYLNEDFTLECNHPGLSINSDDVVIWKLPNGVEIKEASEKYRLHNATSGAANTKLTVKAVEERDAGVYVCHVYSRSSIKRGSLLRGLNLAGPLYRDPFDEYRHSLMVAGVAAACLVVPFATLCLVYKLRYQTAEQRQRKREKQQAQFRHQRFLDEHGKENGTEMATSKGGASNPAFQNSADGIPAYQNSAPSCQTFAADSDQGGSVGPTHL